MDNSIIPIIKELERVYDTLAKKYEIKAPRPIITIQSKGRQKILGWHWEDKWELGKKSISEINICAEELNKDPIETLIHEMVHYANSSEKIDDCNSQQYHNKHFKLRAEKYGLNVEKEGRYGWGLTSLSPQLKETLKELKINYDIFKLFRKTNITVSAPTKMKKYRCECTTVRCAVELKAKCLICNKDFTLQEE